MTDENADTADLPAELLRQVLDPITALEAGVRIEDDQRKEII